MQNLRLAQDILRSVNDGALSGTDPMFCQCAKSVGVVGKQQAEATEEVRMIAKRWAGSVGSFPEMISISLIRPQFRPLVGANPRNVPGSISRAICKGRNC